MPFDASKVFILLVTGPFFGMIAWAEVRLFGVGSGSNGPRQP